MQINAKSTRPFIGAKDIKLSTAFYSAMGFDVKLVAEKLYLCSNPSVQFYLQDSYIKDWIDNTMLFIEVQDVDQCYRQLAALDLPGRFPGARLTSIREDSWGRECFLHDPSGILWHFGSFHQR